MRDVRQADFTEEEVAFLLQAVLTLKADFQAADDERLWTVIQKLCDLVGADIEFIEQDQDFGWNDEWDGKLDS